MFKNNDDEYFRPMQIIDYQNSSMVQNVIDYGHKPTIMDNYQDDFKPVQTFDYGHSSKSLNRRNNTDRDVLNRNSNVQISNRGKIVKKNNNFQHKSTKLLHKSNSPALTKPVKKDITNFKKNVGVPEMKQPRMNFSKKIESKNDNLNFKTEELEEISDTEENLLIDDNESEKLSDIPSINAEEVCSSKSESPLYVEHEQNPNLISIDELLLNPNRITRPKKICIIMRGPPGSGKSHVAKLIKEKENEMNGTSPRILSIDDYFLIENDYEEKCHKTGKKIPKKEILYEFDRDMEETYLQYLIKSFKKTIADNLYDFIIIDCNNSSLQSLNEFYCHSKESGFSPYIIDLICDAQTCLDRNIHERSITDIELIIENWMTTPQHYMKLDVAKLLENVVEMEDVENMVVDKFIDEGKDNNSSILGEQKPVHNEEDSNEATDQIKSCGFLKSKWETDATSENLARLDGTRKIMSKKKATTMEDYLQMEDWVPPKTNSMGKKTVRWADIEEKRKQEKMRAIGFVVGQTDWNRMMDPNAGKRALNKMKYIERVKKRF